MRLDIDDITAIKDSALKVFDNSIAAADSSECWGVNDAVTRLETQLLQLYGIVVLALKHEEDLAVIAQNWGNMVTVCDDVALKIGSLGEEHPYCSVSHDKILDLRNRCARLQNLHS